MTDTRHKQGHALELITRTASMPDKNPPQPQSVVPPYKRVHVCTMVILEMIQEHPVPGKSQQKDCEGTSSMECLTKTPVTSKRGFYKNTCITCVMGESDSGTCCDSPTGFPTSKAREHNTTHYCYQPRCPIPSPNPHERDIHHINSCGCRHGSPWMSVTVRCPQHNAAGERDTYSSHAAGNQDSCKRSVLLTWANKNTSSDCGTYRERYLKYLKRATTTGLEEVTESPSSPTADAEPTAPLLQVLQVCCVPHRANRKRD